MCAIALFPPLGDEWEPTRRTIQLYSRVLAAVAQTHNSPQPRWWHISLKVQPDGLVTDQMVLPDGGRFWFKVDLRQHLVLLLTDGGRQHTFSVTTGQPSTQFGDQILDVLAQQYGLAGKYEREEFESDEPRSYEPSLAESYLTTLVTADRIFRGYRASLSGERGPVQLWPHNFDLAFEWFGTRKVTFEEHGRLTESPAQLSLGFYSGDPDNRPYFYSNPWPFEPEKYLDKALPAGASWHTDGWQGTILPYDELVGDSRAEERLLAYARTVYELVTPHLLA